jgi:threonine/homoserine/homoserine lactone efflux protein
MTLKPSYPIKKPSALNPGLIATVGSQVGGAIFGIIMIALLVGIGLDKLLQTTKHPFTIILFLGSVPFSMIVTYWLAVRATKSLNSQQPAMKQSKPVEEEDKRE